MSERMSAIRPSWFSARTLAAALLAAVSLDVATARAQTAAPAPTAPTSATSPAPTVAATVPAAPTDAATSLERVRASYEYGDIDDVVEWSRPVAEGRLEATPAQRALALRYLGIGLYLTGRAPGAEAAFFELLRLRPDTVLDPRTTRPDVVTFFERVRSGHAQQIKESAHQHKAFIWNFIPPVGQFQNGHTARGLIIGGVEVASLAMTITSYALLSSWEQPHHQFTGHPEAQTMKVVNFVSIGVLAATYFYGVLDGIGHYNDLPDEGEGPARGRVSLSPSGLSLTF
jgi:hypothetical protein